MKKRRLSVTFCRLNLHLDKDMKWKIEKGDIDLLIGASSKDIRLKDSIRITENAWIDGRDRSFYGKVEVK